jgi:hypothetical protein
MNTKMRKTLYEEKFGHLVPSSNRKVRKILRMKNNDADSSVFHTQQISYLGKGGETK